MRPSSLREMSFHQFYELTMSTQTTHKRNKSIRVWVRQSWQSSHCTTIHPPASHPHQHYNTTIHNKFQQPTPQLPPLLSGTLSFFAYPYSATFQHMTYDWGPYCYFLLYFMLPLSSVRQFSARRQTITIKVITERFILEHWVIFVVNDLLKKMKFDTGCMFYDVTPNDNYLFFWMKGKSLLTSDCQLEA